MRLPPDSLIAVEKVIHYLLVPQARGDKSAFLALAGYHRANADALAREIRGHLTRFEALPTEVSI